MSERCTLPDTNMCKQLGQSSAKCTGCGHWREKAINIEPPPACPSCGHPAHKPGKCKKKIAREQWGSEEGTDDFYPCGCSANLQPKEQPEPESCNDCPCSMGCVLIYDTASCNDRLDRYKADRIPLPQPEPIRCEDCIQPITEFTCGLYPRQPKAEPKISADASFRSMERFLSPTLNLGERTRTEIIEPVEMPLIKSFEFGKSIETCECGVCKRVRAQRDADMAWHTKQMEGASLESYNQGYEACLKGLDKHKALIASAAVKAFAEKVALDSKLFMELQHIIQACRDYDDSDEETTRKIIGGYLAEVRSMAGGK